MCFNLFEFYFADSVCTAIDLPSAVTMTFSPAPKTIRHASILFPYRKQAAPAMCCKNCPYLFQFVCVLLCRFCVHGNRLALCGHNDLFTCSKDNTPRINTFSIQKTGSPCDVLQELPIFVSICLGFTLRILPAQQSACPLHPEFPAACPRSRIPWSQQPFSPAPKTARRTWSVPKCFP